MTENQATHYPRSGDTHIAYQVLGEGPPDLLHFFGINVSVDSIDEEPALVRFHSRLASFGRLIRFDCRGLGLSDPLSPSDLPALEQWVQDAVAVLDELGAQSAALLADLTAAPKAILMAASHPDRVTHLVILNGTARVVRAPDYPFGVPQALIELFVNTVTEPGAVDAGLDDLAVFAPSVQDDPVFRSWWVRSGRRSLSPAVARGMLRMDNYSDVREILPLIRVPTLVLHRRDLQTFGIEHGRYLGEHIPGATLLELPGRDSLYWVGETEPMLAEIEEFLTGTHRPPLSTAGSCDGGVHRHRRFHGDGDGTRRPARGATGWTLTTRWCGGFSHGSRDAR